MENAVDAGPAQGLVLLRVLEQYYLMLDSMGPQQQVVCSEQLVESAADEGEARGLIVSRVLKLGYLVP